MDKWTNRPEDRTVDAVSRRYKICRRRVNDLFRKHAGVDFTEPIPEDAYRHICDDVEYLTMTKRLKVLGGK
ncbi:MAG: hypothetical protein J6Y69_10080 [Treponema sp.]|nr:hypothetical protein [Treponema sp.]